MDLSTATAAAAAAALRDGTLRSSALLEAHLDRTDALNPALNLVVAEDTERARDLARKADADRAAGRLWGPLHGLPMTVKDTFETARLTTTCGASRLAGHVPDRDAAAVARLKAAGAIIWGKTNVPTYAGDFQTHNELHGVSRNPWNPDRTPGGSSGGAAAAVATGMTLLELGSDIGGSIRAPAHYTGVYGHKPTWPAISMRGHIPGPPGTLAESDIVVAGPLGRSAADLALALDVLTGGGVAGIPGTVLPRCAPMALSPSALRVGVWADDPAVPTSAACRSAVDRAAAALSDAGAQVRDARPGPPLGEQFALYASLVNAVLAPGFPPRAIDRARAALDAGDVDDPVQQARLRGLTWSHNDWLAADERRRQIMAQLAAWFADNDVLLTPVTVVPAFPHDTARSFDDRTLDVDGTTVPYVAHMAWAGLASLSLLPATAVPMGRTREELPTGVQIIGARWGDRTTIAVGGMLEALCGGFVPPPLSGVAPSAQAGAST